MFNILFKNTNFTSNMSLLSKRLTIAFSFRFYRMAARCDKYWNGKYMARFPAGTRFRSGQPAISVVIKNTVGQSSRDDKNHPERRTKQIVRAFIHHHQPNQVTYGANVGLNSTTTQLDAWLPWPSNGSDLHPQRRVIQPDVFFQWIGALVVAQRQQCINYWRSGTGH